MYITRKRKMQKMHLKEALHQMEEVTKLHHPMVVEAMVAALVVTRK